MKTIKDITYKEWDELDWDERLEITINTLFIYKKVNVEEVIPTEYDFGITIELCCVEDDVREALTKGWIRIKQHSYLELNLWQGNGQPYFTDADLIWRTIYEYLNELEA